MRRRDGAMMVLKPVVAAFALTLLVANGVSAAKRSGGSSARKPSEQVTARKENLPEPANATQPEEKAVKPLVAPSPGQFDMQKEQALEHQRRQVEWITGTVAEIRERLIRLAML